MTLSARFGRTLLEAGGAGAELLVNEWLAQVESYSGLTIEDRDLTAPPGSPADGKVWLVGASATGAWAGEDGKLALYYQGWYFTTAWEGARAWIADENAYALFDGSVWIVTSGPTVTLADGANIAWNLALGPAAEVTLAGNRTLDNPTNIQPGRRYSLAVVQDGTGSRTLAYGSAYKWPSGTAPTLSTGSGEIDLLSFVARGSHLYGSATLDLS